MTQTDERQGMPSDNAAVMAGYTREVHITNGEYDLYLLVKPETDLDDRFRAWDTDAQEWILVDGWLGEVTYLAPVSHIHHD